MVELRKVHANFTRRARHFIDLIHQVEAPPTRSNSDIRNYARHRDTVVMYVTLELQNALAYVSRNVFLAGVLGGKSAAGLKISPISGQLTKNAALMNAAVSVGKDGRQVPGRGEPAWQSADHMMRVVNALRPTNAANILDSLGVFPEARKAVVAARNFYAHRGEDTVRMISDVLRAEYAEILRGHPTPELFRLPVRQTGSFLERWVWNYVDVVEVMCGM